MKVKEIIEEDKVIYLTKEQVQSPFFLLLKQMNDRIERLEKELKLFKYEN